MVCLNKTLKALDKFQINGLNLASNYRQLPSNFVHGLLIYQRSGRWSEKRCVMLILDAHVFSV